MTNLLTGDDTTFATGLGAWQETQNAGNIVATHSSEEGGVLRVEVTTGGGTVAVGTAANGDPTTDKIPVTPDQVLTLSAKTKQISGTGRSHRLQAGFYTAANAVIADITPASMPVNATPGWTTISGTVTVPSTAAFMRVEVDFLSVVAGDVFLIDDYVVDDGVSANTAPTASAGSDQTVASEATVTLTGTDSDSDGSVVSRTWTQTSGPAVTLSGSGASRTLTAPVGPATLVFDYTVTDDDGATATDSVTVTVTAPSANLLTGNTANFSTGAGGWIEATNGASFVAAHSTEDGGVLSLEVTTGGSNIAVASHAPGDAGRPQVTPGQVITVSASCKQVDGAARPWRVEVNWYDEVGPVPGTGNTQVVAGVLTVGQYVTLAGEIEVPAGATRVRLRVWIGTPALGETFYLDNASIATASGTPTDNNLKTYDRVGSSWLLLKEKDVGPGVAPRLLKVRRLNVSSPPPAPDPVVTDLQAVAGDGQVGLSWTEPNPSDDVTDYAIDHGPSATGPWTRFADPVSIGTTGTVTGLTNGTPYWFRVAPVRSGTVGTFSDPVTATPAALPGPSNLRATPGNALVSLAWDAPSSVAGVTDYSVRYRRSTASTWTVAARSASTLTRHTVSGLVNGVSYVFEVAAVRSGVVGVYTAGPVTSSPVAPAPTGSIFDEHVGFGNPNLVNPISIVVTSAADTGPGSLRAACLGNTHKHITFAPALQNAVITVSSALIKVGANTLIDGRGRNVTVKGTLTMGAFLLEDTWNVTIAHLHIRDCGNVALTSSDNPWDGIIIYGSTDIWIHHCSFSAIADKAIGMQRGTKDVTISWSRFFNQEQVVQSGSDSGGELVDGVTRLTVHHVWWDGTGYRHPVMSYGKAHVYNNFYDDFRLYGMRSQRIAKAHFENNVLRCVRSNAVTKISGTGGAEKDSRPGFLTAVGNVALPGSLQPKFETAGHDFVPSAFYAYTAQVAGQALADAIVAGAGPK